MNNGYIFPPNDDLLVTFSDILSQGSFQDSLVCIQDTYPSFEPSNINNKHNYQDEQRSEYLPLQSYTFNHDIYKSSAMSIPLNIMRIITENNSSKPKDISVRYHMPHWKYFEFTLSQQKKFIEKYFPDRMGLYKTYTRDEDKNNLFVYLWLYMNGGVYISPDYELLKSIEPILDNMTDSHVVDLYFMFDEERYISSKFLISQPFCDFWIDAINLMDKRKTHKYPSLQEEIDRNTGRRLLTDVLDDTRHKFEIIPRLQLDPYSPCDTEYNKDSYLYPINRNQSIVTYVSCQTGTSKELLYVTAAVVLVIAIMVIIALITN